VWEGNGGGHKAEEKNKTLINSGERGDPGDDAAGVRNGKRKGGMGGGRGGKRVGGLLNSLRRYHGPGRQGRKTKRIISHESVGSDLGDIPSWKGGENISGGTAKKKVQLKKRR